MRTLLCLLLAQLPAPSPQSDMLRKALSTPASRPGHSDDWRRGTWFDALQDFAAQRGVNLNNGVGELLR